MLNEEVVSEDFPVIFKPQRSRLIEGWDCLPKDMIWGGIFKKNGSCAFVYWNSTELTTVRGYEGTVSMELVATHGDVRLVDPMDGSIYEIGENIMKEGGNGLYHFEHLPIKDYPMLITFGNFMD